MAWEEVELELGKGSRLFRWVLFGLGIAAIIGFLVLAAWFGWKILVPAEPQGSVNVVRAPVGHDMTVYVIEFDVPLQIERATAICTDGTYETATMLSGNSGKMQAIAFFVPTTEEVKRIEVYLAGGKRIQITSFGGR